MGSKHVPELVKLAELTTARAELLGMVESIDRGIAAMKKAKADKMWMYYRASLDGVNGGMVRLGAFISGLDQATRRLSAGNPIYEGESKLRSKSISVEEPAQKIAEDPSMYQAFQEVMQEMGPEVKKRVNEKMKNTAKAATKKKPKPL